MGANSPWGKTGIIRFANESVRQRPVRQRMKSIRQLPMSVRQRLYDSSPTSKTLFEIDLKCIYQLLDEYSIYTCQLKTVYAPIYNSHFDLFAAFVFCLQHFGYFQCTSFICNASFYFLCIFFICSVSFLFAAFLFCLQCFFFVCSISFLFAACP